MYLMATELQYSFLLYPHPKDDKKLKRHMACGLCRIGQQTAYVLMNKGLGEDQQERQAIGRYKLAYGVYIFMKCIF